jgi:RNA polymerase sigma-70 factor (ECF subfamily)
LVVVMVAISRCDDAHAIRWQDHHELLLARALRLCGDLDDAHDLVQETYLRALTAEARFIPGSNAAAWLTTILRRLFIDEWRRRHRVTHVQLAEAEDLAVVVEGEPASWDNVSAQELAAAVGKLGPSFRAVFVLHAMQRRSYREIGASLGIPTATVGTRLARARQKLKRALSTS